MCGVVAHWIALNGGMPPQEHTVARSLISGVPIGKQQLYRRRILWFVEPSTRRQEKGRVGRTSQEARLPVAVAVAVPDDAGLHECAAPDRRDAVRVVVRQVEVAAEPEAHAGVRLREADEGGGVAGVVQPRAPVLHVHLLDHLRSGAASHAASAKTEADHNLSSVG